jgi:hypothetical protein
MNESALIDQILPCSLMAVAGLLLGIAYFRALRRSVLLFVGGGRWPAVALTLVRLVATVALLVLAARLGPLPLLAAFLGFLASRLLALRSWRRIL